jgi:hypothetical protein
MAKLILGKDLHTKEEVSISQKERLRGLYGLGSTGTGKTTFLNNLVLQDMQAGHGLCYLSPVKDAIDDILTRIPPEREKDVILFDPLVTDVVAGLNLFACPDSSSDAQVALTSGLVMHTFEKAFGVGPETPRLTDVLRNVTITLIENNLTMAEIPLILQDSSFRSRVVKNVSNEQVNLWWQIYNNLRPSEQLELVASTLNKVNAFLTNPLIGRIISQTKSTIDFRLVMDENKILLVQLDPRLEDIAVLLGATIIGKILEAAYSREDTPSQERKLFALFVDEFQRYATDDMATLLAEARKFGIASTIAHQFRGQLSEKVKGATFNAATTVVFKIGADDKEEVAALFNTTPSPPEVEREEVLIPRRNVLTQLLNYGHKSQAVTDFTSRYLAQIELGSKQHRETRTIHTPLTVIKAYAYPPVDYDQCRYRYDPFQLQKGLLSLNELLYHSMVCSDPLLPLSEQATKWYFEACGSFKYFLGFPHYFDGEVLKKAELMQPPSAWPEGIPYYNSTARIFGRLARQETNTPDDGIYPKDNPSLFLFYHFGVHLQPTIVKLPPILKMGEYKERGSSWHYDCTPLYPVASDIRNSEESRYQAFWKALSGVMDALHESPISKGGGHWVQRQGTRQTHADKQNEIGNALTHLDRFTAWVKLNNKERVMKTLPLPPRNNVKLTDLICAIRQKNVSEGYLRPVSQVKAEIRKRQEMFTPALTSKQREEL